MEKQRKKKQSYLHGEGHHKFTSIVHNYSGKKKCWKCKKMTARKDRVDYEGEKGGRFPCCRKCYEEELRT